MLVIAKSLGHADTRVQLWSVGNNPASANVIRGGRIRAFAASCP
jgi:hypothetical protein